VPTSTTGRLVAALVMVVGIGFLTVITAAITSAFVESARADVDGTQLGRAAHHWSGRSMTGVSRPSSMTLMSAAQTAAGVISISESNGR
jgi:hypothetical protein